MTGKTAYTSCRGCDRPVSGRQVWCSEACRLRAYRRNRPAIVLVCDDCGAEFEYSGRGRHPRLCPLDGGRESWR